MKIEGVRPKSPSSSVCWQFPRHGTKDYAASSDDRVRCMVLNTGKGDCHAYVYFNISDTEYASATAEVNGKRLGSATYPMNSLSRPTPDISRNPDLGSGKRTAP